MEVVNDLRLPAVIKKRRGGLALRLGEHVPVAIVVVAVVMVIEERHFLAFPFGAEALLVPVHHHLGAVGVVAGQHDDHRLVENVEDARVLAGREQVRKFHRGLRRRDLGRVDAVVVGDDGLAGGDQFRRLFIGKAARVGEAQVRLADGLEVGHVLLGGDHHREEGLAERRLAFAVDLHPPGRGIELAEVVDDLRPVGELAIGAHLETQDGFRGWDVGSAGERGRGEKCGEEEE